MLRVGACSWVCRFILKIATPKGRCIFRPGEPLSVISIIIWISKNNKLFYVAMLLIWLIYHFTDSDPCLPCVSQIIFRIKWKGNFPTEKRWFSSFTSSEVRQIKQRGRIQQRCIHWPELTHLLSHICRRDWWCSKESAYTIACAKVTFRPGPAKHLKFTWISVTGMLQNGSGFSQYLFVINLWIYK